MGFCYYFHRTWTPGYNTEYIDPNLAYSFQRKLQLAKKVAWWMFVSTLLACIILLLVKLYTSHALPDCSGNATTSQTTPLSQATAESRFQTLQPINQTNVTDVDLLLDSMSTSTENEISYVYQTQPSLKEFQENDVNSLVLAETSTMEYQIEDTKTVTLDLEETIVHYVTEESLNAETESEKPNDFTELLNHHLLNFESDEGLVKRNMTTREDVSSTHRFQPDTGCGPTDFRCNATQKCIPVEQRCDGRLDCAEPQETVVSSEIDRSDEIGCICKPESFVCEKKTTSPMECIHMHLVCDSFDDCQNKKDEAVCTAVSESLKKVSLTDKRKKEIKGFVLVRVRGSWHPYCKKDWSTTLGQKICKFFGFQKLVVMQTIGLKDLNNRIGVNLTSRTSGTEEELHRTEKSPLWLLKGSDDYLAVTGGPIEDVVTEATEDEEYDCTVGHVVCTNNF